MFTFKKSKNFYIFSKNIKPKRNFIPPCVWNGKKPKKHQKEKDMNGKQIQQITLTERGNSSVTISGGELNAGMYLYSLIADGQVIDTKRMILTK